MLAKHRLILALFVATAHAEDGNDARKLGAAIAKAQERNDLVAEQRLWRDVRARFAEEDPRATWIALMEPLDPKRGGAFVSAHLLAERLLYACIEHDDTKHLEAATAVLAERARAKEAGRHVVLVHRLAMAVAANGMGADEVCAEAAGHGWAELAGWAAIGTFQGDGGDAKKAEDAVVTAMIAADDSALAMAWAQPIKRRLRGNAHAVSAVTRVMREIGAISVQPLVAPGADGSDTTELGRRWRRIGKRKPIATVKRTTALEVEHGFERYKVALAIRPGVKLHEHGGLVLALNRHGVALRSLGTDRVGARGNESELPGPYELVHRLAKDETWTLTKSGVRIR